jgi:uncharacterized membrane protein YcaP (DUF421 family)
MSLDWHAIFVPESPLEMIVRGTVSYWFLFALFRIAVRRRVGAVGMADILILVIVSDAIQNAMAGEYTSATDGFILVATLVGWALFTDWAAFHFPAIRRLLEPPPLLLIRNGRLVRRNLRSEFISDVELRAKMRENGVQDYSEVEAAYMETDGQITFVKKH